MLCGEICVSGVYVGKYYCFSVIDNGFGVLEDVLLCLFELFFMMCLCGFGFGLLLCDMFV